MVSISSKAFCKRLTGRLDERLSSLPPLSYINVANGGTGFTYDLPINSLLVGSMLDVQEHSPSENGLIAGRPCHEVSIELADVGACSAPFR